MRGVRAVPVNISLLTSIIGIFGAAIIAAVTYWLTKKREQEAEWRKEKLAYYKAFIESLSGTVEGDSTPDGQRAYAKACNNLLLFAPVSVLEAMEAFRNETKESNPNRSFEKHDLLLAKLLLEIRRDIRIYPQDNPDTFKPKLWSSGSRKNLP